MSTRSFPFVKDKDLLKFCLITQDKGHIAEINLLHRVNTVSLKMEKVNESHTFRPRAKLGGTHLVVSSQILVYCMFRG